jgi:hypothetical protein
MITFGIQVLMWLTFEPFVCCLSIFWCAWNIGNAFWRFVTFNMTTVWSCIDTSLGLVLIYFYEKNAAHARQGSYIIECSRPYIIVADNESKS